MTTAPSDDQSGLPPEELRLALVMNGGVSLAVWMGGVSYEIFRVATARHPVYADLLDLTSTVARVDVISGTSAGGVNGAALALALLYGGDFASLRRVWLDTGSFSDLLRPVTGDNPGSLLQGDEFFLPRIEEAFRALVPEDRAAPVSASDNPIDLRLTTTLLTGVQGNNVDDLGTPLHDVDYRAYFHFGHGNGRADFDKPDVVVPKLARAARSTASFPFAFEPSHVTKDDAGPHLHSLLEQDLELPRYVIDGGVLDNKPFHGAREAIFGMKTYGAVRRVLAYVNPDPGDGPPGKTGGDVPPLSAVLVEGLFEIPQSQTIADQLAAIAEHNESVRSRKDSVTSIASLGDGTLEKLPRQLYEAYYRRRLSSTFELFVYAPLSDAARDNPDHAYGLRAVGKSIRQQMRLAFLRYGGLREHGTMGPASGGQLDWLPREWPSSPDDATFDPVKWEWGLFPVEFGAKLLLDMLRMTQKLVELTDPPPPHDPPLAHPADGHPAPDASGEAWIDPDERLAASRRRSTAEPDANVVTLARLWNKAVDVLTALEKRRDDERARWNGGTQKLLEELAAFARAAVDPRSADEADRWWTVLEETSYPNMFRFLSEADRKKFCGTQAFIIAQLLKEVAHFALAENRKARMMQLRRLEEDLCNRLFVLAKRFDLDDLNSILYRVMQLEVVEYTFNDHEKLNTDTNIELVQISGNSASPLGGRSSARDKLLGLQLAHFGAFYKKSWRANDWLYGRLAGAERMVKILINPERIHRRYFRERGAVDKAVAAIEQIAVGSVPSKRLQGKLAQIWASEHYATRIRGELRFLEDPAYPLPDSLPYTTRAITTRLHFGILAEELPELIGAIHQDQADGAGVDGPGEAILRDLGDGARRELDDAMRAQRAADRADRWKRGTRHAPTPGTSAFRAIAISPEQAQRWLQNDLLGRETLLGQAGSDMFTRTLAHTAATLQGTIASKAAHLGPLSVLFASIKLPVLGFFLATRGLLGQSRTSAALNGGAMILGLALVLVGFFWTPEAGNPHDFPHGLVTLGWALLAYTFIVSALRDLFTVAVGATLVAAILAVHMLTSHDDLNPNTTPIALSVFVVLGLSALSARYILLQPLLGAVLFGIAAAWTSGYLFPPHDLEHARPILMFAGALFAALAVQAFQASSWLVRIKAFWRRSRREDVIHRYLGGMYVRIETRSWNGNRIRDAHVAEVPQLGAAFRHHFHDGDRLLRIDGEPLSGMTVEEFERRMRAHDAPVLSVSRTVEGKPKTIDLPRAPD